MIRGLTEAPKNKSTPIEGGDREKNNNNISVQKKGKTKEAGDQ